MERTPLQELILRLENRAKTLRQEIAQNELDVKRHLESVKAINYWGETASMELLVTEQTIADLMTQQTLGKQP
jgi:hypothetical protein